MAHYQSQTNSHTNTFRINRLSKIVDLARIQVFINIYQWILTGARLWVRHQMTVRGFFLFSSQIFLDVSSRNFFLYFFVSFFLFFVFLNSYCTVYLLFLIFLCFLYLYRSFCVLLPSTLQPSPLSLPIFSPLPLSYLIPITSQPYLLSLSTFSPLSLLPSSLPSPLPSLLSLSPTFSPTFSSLSLSYLLLSLSLPSTMHGFISHNHHLYTAQCHVINWYYCNLRRNIIFRIAGRGVGVYPPPPVLSCIYGAYMVRISLYNFKKH